MSQESIELILYKLSELDKKVEEVRADQKMAATKVCPSPGACVSLARDVDQIKKAAEDREARIRKLESAYNQAKGMGMAGKALWAFIGAGGLGVAYKVMQLIAK